MENQEMTRNSRMVALAAGSAMLALQTAPAVAEGTSAGTVITNTATVDYRVAGVDQTDLTAQSQITVDRKINVLVNRVSDPTTSVVPGQADAVIAFDVSNLSNATIDLVIAATQASSGDDFDVTGLTLYRDDGEGVFDAGDTVTTLLDEVAEDAVVRVFVVSDTPLSQANGDIANLFLSATAHEGGQASTQGSVITATSGGNTSGVDTALADGAGQDDSANDGVFTARGSYTVSAATLTVAKTNRVLDDPVNGTTDPKAIPGATVEYCIAVSNAAGSATATNVVVTDVLPGDLSFVTGSIRVNGALDGSNNCTGGDPGGSIAGSTITAPLSDIAGDETLTASFRATIN
jgi:uncharacterized repeat protein (TIGR01451 family)